MLESLVESTDPATIDSLVERAAEIGNRIKLIPPTLAADEVRERLRNVLSAEMDWSREHDAVVCRQLREIANEVDRMKRLKNGGITLLPDDVRDAVKQIVQDLNKYGLFMVPVGELEQWFEQSEVLVTKQNKPAWANAAAAYIRNNEVREDGVWEFIRAVARFLNL